MKKLALTLFCLVGLQPSAQAQDVNQATRSRDLTELSRVIGAMHHFHMLCHPYDYPQLYRDRMKELVTLEEPQPSARTAMIEAFNGGFNTAQVTYEFCGYEAETEMRRLADEGGRLTARLAAPFRDVYGYDYGDGDTVENGVRIYRGGQ